MKRSDKHQEIVDNLVAVFSTTPKDQVVSYEELSQICGCDVKTHGRMFVYAAQKELQKAYKRTITCVRGVGYLVPQARNHEHLAKKQHQHAISKMVRGVKVMAAADEAELTAIERQRKDQISYAYERVIANQLLMAKELRKQGEILNMHHGEIGHHENEIEGLKDRIAALEKSKIMF